MTVRAWSSDADGGVRTSILTAQTTPAPDLTRRVTPQNPRSQHYHHDFAEALLLPRGGQHDQGGLQARGDRLVTGLHRWRIVAPRHRTGNRRRAAGRGDRTALAVDEPGMAHRPRGAPRDHARPVHGTPQGQPRPG